MPGRDKMTDREKAAFDRAKNMPKGGGYVNTVTLTTSATSTDENPKNIGLMHRACKFLGLKFKNTKKWN